jgi:hypothetical protein
MTAHETRSANDGTRGDGGIFLRARFLRCRIWSGAVFSGRRAVHDVRALNNSRFALFQVVVAGVSITIAWIAAHGKNPFVLTLITPRSHSVRSDRTRQCGDRPAGKT